MSEPTQRWLARDVTAVLPVELEPPRADPLPPTLVSDRFFARPSFVTPVVFPGYEILGELGRGGMGVVYKARQRNLNRLVALKVILGGPLASEEDKARFRIEAEAAARLHHPNIVQVYDVGEHAGFSYMALELVEGDTLRKWQNGAPIEPRLAARLAATVARAVHHAHEQGIVHRDIKPANILFAVDSGQWAVGSEGKKYSSSSLPTAHCPLSTLAPKIADFGLAKALIGGTDLTVTGVACGTPNYMAPEQVRGKPPGPGMDVYGLGAVLYELLTGRPPFVGTDATEVMNLIVRTEPIGVRKLAPAVPRDLAVIVAKCLEKDPARRYLSARDAADDLDRFLAGTPITARPVGAAERACRWTRRNPVVAAFLVLATVGCALTGGLALALARTAGDERAARATAEASREEAERQRVAAVAARDATEAARAATEVARVLADRERKAAKDAKVLADAAREAALVNEKRAVEKQNEADAARARAEDNLRVARWVIRGSMRELSRHPRFDEEDFRDARLKLLEQVRQFRDTVAAHAPNTSEWLDDLSDVSHFLGYLEFVNQNNNAAGTEYKTAADAAGRWAKLEPRKTEPRARQAYSLLNAGNAFLNVRRFRDAETCYRDAGRLIDAVVPDEPLNLNYRYQAVESYGKLARMYRIEGNLSEWYRVSEVEAQRAEALMRTCAATPDSRRQLATAQQSLALILSRLRKFDEADCHFADAVALREQIRDAARPGAVLPVTEYAATLLEYAEFLNTRGHPQRAGETFSLAAGALEKAHATAPDAEETGTELAAACSRYADFLRARRRMIDAERVYDRAIEITDTILRRAPASRPAREAWVSAATGRAHLYNATDRHRRAVEEWTRLAVEDPDPRNRPQHELFVIQSLLFARDWRVATASADALMKRNHLGWMWLDLGRCWCLIAREIDTDDALAPAEKLAATESVVRKGVACLERARAAGEFNSADRVRWFATHPDFAPLRGKFDPQKK